MIRTRKKVRVPLEVAHGQDAPDLGELVFHGLMTLFFKGMTYEVRSTLRGLKAVRVDGRLSKPQFSIAVTAMQRYRQDRKQQ